jgi:hypothetical protein
VTRRTEGCYLEGKSEKDAEKEKLDLNSILNYASD